MHGTGLDGRVAFMHKSMHLKSQVVTDISQYGTEEGKCQVWVYGVRNGHGLDPSMD